MRKFYKGGKFLWCFLCMRNISKHSFAEHFCTKECRHKRFLLLYNYDHFKWLKNWILKFFCWHLETFSEKKKILNNFYLFHIFSSLRVSRFSLYYINMFSIPLFFIFVPNISICEKLYIKIHNGLHIYILYICLKRLHELKSIYTTTQLIYVIKVKWKQRKQ